jgi:hypothetical protein
MKRSVFTAILLIGCAFSLFCQNANDFLYVTQNGGITITGYIGSEKDVNIPKTINGLPVLSIGDSAFFRNRLTSLTLPDTITVIGAKAFSYNRLTRLVLPDSVITVEYGAFSNNRLASLTLSNSIDSIGMMAFNENRLKEINLPESLVYIGDGSFTKNFLSEVTIPRSVRNFNSWAFDVFVKITRRQ